MKKKIFLLTLTILFTMLTLSSCKKSYTITFDTDGGSTVAAVEVKKGEKVARPTDPTKEGFGFVEWQRDGKTYNFDEKVKSSFTLKAVWEQNKNLNAPTNVKLEGNTVKWDAVKDATSYDVHIGSTVKTTNSSSYTLESDNYFAFIYVVARRNSSTSDHSEGVVYHVKPSDSELDNFLEALGSYRHEGQQIEWYEILYALSKEYNVPAADLYAVAESGDLEEILPVISKYASEKRLSDMLSVFAIYLFEGFKLQGENMELDDETLEEYNSLLQQLFKLMTSEGVYQSKETNALNDELFVNVVAPCLVYIGSRYVYDFGNTLAYLNLISEDCNIYQVSRVHEVIYFTNRLTGKTYEMTLSEIDKIIEFSKGRYEYRSIYYIYRDKLRMEGYSGLVEKYNANNFEFYSYMLNTLPQLDGYFTDVFNSIENITTNVMQMSELIPQLANPELTSSEKRQLLIQLFALKEKLINSCEKVLPSDKTIEDLYKLSDLFEVADLLNIMANMPLKVEIFDYLEDYLKAGVSVVKDVLAYLKDYNNPDAILAILDAYVAGDLSKVEEANAAIEQLIIDLMEVLESNKDLRDLDKKGLYYLFVSFVEGMDESKLSLLIGQKVDDELFNRFVSEIEEFTEFCLKNVDSEVLEALVEKVLNAYLSEEEPEFTYEELEPIVNAALKYLTKEKVAEYKDIIVGILEYVLYNTGEKASLQEQAEALYKIVMDNFDTLKVYAEGVIKVRLTIVCSKIEDMNSEDYVRFYLDQISVWEEVLKNKNINFYDMVDVIVKISTEVAGESIDSESVEAIKYLLDKDPQEVIETLKGIINKDSSEITEEENMLVSLFNTFFGTSILF